MLLALLRGLRIHQWLVDTAWSIQCNFASYLPPKSTDTEDSRNRHTCDLLALLHDFLGIVSDQPIPSPRLPLAELTVFGLEW